MDNSTIGIKIADGTYFPVLEGEITKKKKLVLTTVNDDQSSVQIDLYKGEGKSLAEAMYIGSLVIEDIMPEMKGEPEIELILGVDKDGTLNAVAGDAGSGEKQSLSVSLKSLEENEFETPDFELDETVFDDVPSFEEDSDNDDESMFDDMVDSDEDSGIEDMSDLDDLSFDDELSMDDESVFDDEPSFDDELSMDDESVFDDEPSFDDELSFDDDSAFDDEPSFDDELSMDDESAFDDEPSFDDESESSDSDEGSYPDEYKKKRSLLAIIVLIILILAIIGLGAFLIIRGLNGDTVPPLEADSRPAVSDPEYTEPAVEEPVIEAEAEPELPAVEEVAPVEVAPPKVVADSVSGGRSLSDGIPPEGQGGGVWYRLKWGDTLWDLSNSFYRTPWLYGLIAVENRIKNPDIIYAGTDILIPEN